MGSPGVRDEGEGLRLRVIPGRRPVAEIVRELSAAHPGVDPMDLEQAFRANNGLPPQCTISDAGVVAVNCGLLEPRLREQWARGSRHVLRAVDQSPQLRGLMAEEPSAVGPFEQFAELCERSGWCTGSSIARVSSYAAGSASAYAYTMNAHLGSIASLASDVRTEVLGRFGNTRSPFGLARSQTAEVGRWLHASPGYQQLRGALDELPRFLRSRLGASPPALGSPLGAHGAWLRRELIVPRAAGDPAAYMSRLARRLGGQVVRYGKIGRRMTWYVPAIIGVYETATAPAGTRLRTAAGQAAGIAMGATGTALGGYVVLVLLAAAPGAVVLAASVAAGAYVGYRFFEWGKDLGEWGYDWMSSLELEPLKGVALSWIP